MDAKSESSLTQIQKYKALLAVTRRRGNDKMTRKSKKKQRHNDTPACPTSPSDDSKAAGTSASPDMTEVTQNMILQDPNKQNNKDSSNIKATTMTGEEQSNESTTTLHCSTSREVGSTMSSDKEMQDETKTALKADQGQTTEQKEPEIERAKKGRLSFRRKKKKSKSSIPEPDSLQQDKQQAEIPPERDESPPKTAMNSDLNSSAENLSQSEETTEITDGKEKKKETVLENKDDKVSGTKKFRRWASFSAKQKKKDAESKSGDPKHKSNGAKLKRVSSDSNLMKDNKENNGDVNRRDNNKGSQLSKEERRKRSVSFAEKVEYNDDDLVAVVETRTRSASFSDDSAMKPLDVKSDVKNEEEKISDEPKEISHEKPEQDQPTETTEIKQDIVAADETKTSEITGEYIEKDSPVEKNEEEKELESLSDIEVNEKTDDEYTTAGDMTAEEDNNTETKPKKKKKRFLRKLSSRNIKRKDSKSLTKDDISSPLELTDGEAAVNDAEQSEPEEHSKEKDRKRKKSVFGLKLPKPLKKRKSSPNEQPANTTENDNNSEKKTDTQHDDNKEEQQQSPAGKNTEDKCEQSPAKNTTLEGQTEENIETQQNDSFVDKEQSEQCETLVSEQEGRELDDKQDGSTDEMSPSETNESGQILEHDVNSPEKQPEEINDTEEEQPILASTPSDMKETELAGDKDVDLEENIEDEEKEENHADECNDDLQDSSLSVSEITMLELGDESSLLAIPAIQENAQEHDIHELSSCVTPDVTQECEITQETEVSEEEPERDETKDQAVTPEIIKSEDSGTTEEKLSASSESSKDSTTHPVQNVTRPLSPEVCNAVRSFEMSVRTKTMVDSYILIDQQLEVSQDFMRQMELMNNRKNRCFVM